ncbi:peptidoglycan recognition protein family protein [Streptomyces fulvoviolaceus]|uniref:peptidoglycan recognition protein family protein n=1 Tax=Streptomyces fulvoviolaceus TaxID=285535 RepID=UPI0021BF1D34|nr:N-acetylmuramoyl-L-alanine amidase [Streptomyces fulvoviolaceus]MCT9081789.1 N-acetylmuramoyl-L-alanine amidase [Streptomyces fulvoviolaceus]
MRGLLASSIGVTCAVALALPLTPPAAAANPAAARPASTAREAPAAEPLGSTQSLPLAPLTRDRSLGPAAEQGLTRRDVRHFSLVGVVWDNPDTELHGRVQVRTRATDSATWSGWQDLETHNADHYADPDTAERTSGRVRGATAPLWVGDSDGVEVRVRADTDGEQAASLLPSGLRLELVDPGEEAPTEEASAATPPRHLAPTAEPAEALTAVDASAANAGLAPLGATEIPALNRSETEQELYALRAGELTRQQQSRPKIGPRPRIVTRRGWGADEKLREKKFVYTKRVKAAFVHHTATGNGYRCAQVPSLIRGIYRYHVRSMGWRDIGYNFLVDKCGNIYEGRAGGVAKPVLGAHTLGFNTNSMGIAVLGTYGYTKPSAAAVRAVARLTAWKLGLFGANPRGKTYLKSGGGNLYRKGRNVRLNVISGHRDGFSTECPGRQLYRKLGSARATAARYQGR